MSKWKLENLVNLDALQTMFDGLYPVIGIPAGILDNQGNILVATEFQDICTKFHRVNPSTLMRCKNSEDYIINQLKDDDIVTYKCINNLYEVALPIIVEGEYLGSVMMGQFFYDDEIIDFEIFKKQSIEFGFNQDEYLEALKKVPVFSRDKIKNIIEYCRGLVTTLIETSISKLNNSYANNKYSILFNSINDYIFIIDSQKRVIECNKEQSIYYHKEEFFGKKYTDVLPDKFSKLLDDAIERLDYQKVAQQFDYSVFIDGKERWFNAQVNEVEHQMKEKSKDYMVVCHEFTCRKRIIDELQNAKNKAEEANNAKNTFVANISHELKTPIAVIFSAIQLFELKIDNTPGIDKLDYSKHIRTIKQNCRRLTRLINNLIDITKVDGGFMSLQLVNVEIVGLVKKITLSVTEYAKVKGLELVFNAQINSMIIAVDPDKIERIVLNLLSNAIKFTEKNNTITVNVYENKNDVFISVRDNCIGISEEKLDHIFERFNQIGDLFSRNHEGSGIGLSLVKSFTEMHGGSISVETELGKGSEFIVRLPVNDEVEKNSVYNCNYDNNDIYKEMLRVELSDIFIC